MAHHDEFPYKYKGRALSAALSAICAGIPAAQAQDGESREVYPERFGSREREPPEKKEDADDGSEQRHRLGWYAQAKEVNRDLPMPISSVKDSSSSMITPALYPAWHSGAVNPAARTLSCAAVQFPVLLSVTIPQRRFISMSSRSP